MMADIGLTVYLATNQNTLNLINQSVHKKRLNIFQNKIKKNIKYILYIIHQYLLLIPIYQLQNNHCNTHTLIEKVYFVPKNQ